MKDIIIERSAVNIDALDAELRAALGPATSGFTLGGGKVIVHLVDTAAPQQENQARQIILNHDPARLTPEQQADILRRAKLDQARKDYGAAEIDLSLYSSQGPVIQLLATKIAWLEREIADLRRA